MKVFATALMILGFVTPATAQSPIQYDSPELTSGKVHVKRVVLAPVQALVSQLNWKSGVYDPGTPMEAESQKLETDLNPVVAATLKSLGFTVDDAFLSPESLAGNKDLGDKVKLVQDAFAMQKNEIESHKKRYATEPVSLGDAVTDLHVPDDSDAIVIIRARDFVETKGKKFMNAAPGYGLQSTGGWYLDIGIVDAKTGAILFIVRAIGGNADIVKEPEKAGPKIEKSFKNFFKYNAASTGPKEPKS